MWAWLQAPPPRAPGARDLRAPLSSLGASGLPRGREARDLSAHASLLRPKGWFGLQHKPPHGAPRLLQPPLPLVPIGRRVESTSHPGMSPRVFRAWPRASSGSVKSPSQPEISSSSGGT